MAGVTTGALSKSAKKRLAKKNRDVVASDKASILAATAPEAEVKVAEPTKLKVEVASSVQVCVCGAEVLDDSNYCQKCGEKRPTTRVATTPLFFEKEHEQAEARSATKSSNSDEDAAPIKEGSESMPERRDDADSDGHWETCAASKKKQQRHHDAKKKLEEEARGKRFKDAQKAKTVPKPVEGKASGAKRPGSTSCSLDDGSSDLATRVLGLMQTRMGSPPNDKPWANKTEMTIVDLLIQRFLPLSSIPLNVSEKLSPIAAIEQMKNQLYTQVLATVYCPGWRASWAMGVLGMILSSYAECTTLRLLAVKGGPGCDGEIEFLTLLMPLLGFQRKDGIKEHRVGKPIRREDDEGKIVRLNWYWQIDRPGAEPMAVFLDQFRTVEMCEHMDVHLNCKESQSAAPNLKRVAVISCPVFDADGNEINEALNKKIGASLDRAIERAKNKGYQPDAKGYGPSKKTWAEYFDREDDTKQ